MRTVAVLPMDPHDVVSPEQPPMPILVPTNTLFPLQTTAKPACRALAGTATFSPRLCQVATASAEAALLTHTTPSVTEYSRLTVALQPITSHDASPLILTPALANHSIACALLQQAKILSFPARLHLMHTYRRALRARRLLR